MNGLGDKTKKKSCTIKTWKQKSRLKKDTLKEIHNTWRGYNYGTVNDTPHGGCILILARKDMDMEPIETGQDTEKKEGGHGEYMKHEETKC